MRDTEDDDVASQKNHEALGKELQKDRPRKEIVLSLARQTYPGRRASVLSDADDVCVASLLTEYQELRKPYVVSKQTFFVWCLFQFLLIFAVIIA